MVQKKLESILKNWIEEDRNVNAIWTVKESASDPETIHISGKTSIILQDRTVEVIGSCLTHNDDESIGKAIQSINDGILAKLQNI